MNVSFIFSEFGGPRPLARILGYPPSTVQNWHDRQSIPSKHQGKILHAALIHGKNIKPEHFFDMPTKAHNFSKKLKKPRSN